VADSSINGCYVAFTVDGNPIPKARPVTRWKDGQKPRTFTPRTTAAWEAIVGLRALQAMRGRDPLRGPVAVELHFYRKDRAACDFDNLAKAVIDAVQRSPDAPFGIVILDDVQVVEAHIFKDVDPDNPRVEVRVQELPGEHGCGASRASLPDISPGQRADTPGITQEG
jgi:Holliday junction resolvase RusA-like endonuclease